MRIDIITIFPEFFSVLDVSLVGKARQSGLIDLRVHNLRDHTHDRHHTVDDTPYGGGAGMVMKPGPWGDAIDAILSNVQTVQATEAAPSVVDAPEGAPSMLDVPQGVPLVRIPATDAAPLLIFPSPAGELFTQAMARELAEEPNRIVGCGRYEGIDQRVFDHFAAEGRVRLVSLGDYVLNGGEVAVMAMIEAVGRLIPGVVGNPESLVEESHEDGLLEYPSYTKPSAWRGLEVPPVLLSGNHGAIAAWRREQQLERTARVRPDLLPPAN